MALRQEIILRIPHVGFSSLASTIVCSCIQDLTVNPFIS